MRISLLKSDKGYHGAASLVKPYLDGKEIKHCVTVDDVLGVAVCHNVDNNGDLVLSKDKKRILLIVKKGLVKIDISGMPEHLRKGLE